MLFKKEEILLSPITTNVMCTWKLEGWNKLVTQ